MNSRAADKFLLFLLGSWTVFQQFEFSAFLLRPLNSYVCPHIWFLSRDPGPLTFEYETNEGGRKSTFLTLIRFNFLRRHLRLSSLPSWLQVKLLLGVGRCSYLGGLGRSAHFQLGTPYGSWTGCAPEWNWTACAPDWNWTGCAPERDRAGCVPENG